MSSLEDKIWIYANRRLDAICEEALEATANHSNALILAHFKTTLAQVEDHLNARAIDYRSYSQVDFASLCPHGFENGPGIFVGLASYFQARSVPPTEHLRSSVHILVAEHHPMALRDRALLDAAESLPCSTGMIYHTSLSDTFMMHFGGERL